MLLAEFKNKVYPLKHKVFRLAKWLLNHNEDAEDVAQEIMLRAWAMRERLHDYKSIEALLITMTRNLCLDKLKTARRSISDITLLKIEDAAPSQLQTLLSNERQQIIDRIIRALPEQQRTVIQLRSVEGLSFDEMADITGLSINNIRVSLSRARKSIRESYLKFMADEKR
jgi:RNA polymerase sigma factor (sigma-70 family)